MKKRQYEQQSLETVDTDDAAAYDDGELSDVETTDGEPVFRDLGDSFTVVIDPCDDSSEAPQTELDTISDFFDVHGDDQ